MDRANKIKGALKGPLKPKDSLFRGTAAVPPGTVQPSSQQYPERVTLPLTTEQKDLLDDLGKKLQRQRTRKEQDLNRNTIIRSLVALLDDRSFDGVSVNNEQELTAWMRSRFID